MSLVVLDAGSETIPPSFIESLSVGFQRDVPPDVYEILVATTQEERYARDSMPQSRGMQARIVRLSNATEWIEIAASEARGRWVGFLKAPGVASPTTVSSLVAALDAYHDAVVILRAVDVRLQERSDSDERALFSDAHALLERATTASNGKSALRWLDPIDEPENVVAPRSVIDAVLATSRKRPLAPRTFTEFAGVACVQLVGDAIIRPAFADDQRSSVEPTRKGGVDPTRSFFGHVQHRIETRTPARPARRTTRDAPKLSVILVVHDMAREAPRTLASLLPSYQRDVGSTDYEIIVVDNGSTTPLGESAVHAVAPQAMYLHLPEAPASPASAINLGVARARGEALAVMIDGACLLTPGVLAEGLRAWRAFPRPIVLTRYFFLGPGSQRADRRGSYDRGEEDRLLSSIDWPSDGYRLFEVGSPLTFGGSTETWFTRWFESNCLFLPRSVFDEIGGCDERFDLPGGGALPIDLLIESCKLEDTQPVQLIGEGVFHQIHGGTTSNTTEEDAQAKARAQRAQYVALRGPVPDGISKAFYFSGRITTLAARRSMLG